MKRLLLLLLFPIAAFGQSWSGRSTGDARVTPPYRFCVGEDNGLDVCLQQSAANVAKILNGSLDFALVAKTVATLPAAASNVGRVYRVTDGTSSADCTTGHGSTSAVCVSDGLVWAPLGGGGGGSPISLKTNGTNNGSQSTLNLKNGTGVSVTDDGVGGITITNTAPGTGSPAGNAGDQQINNGSTFAAGGCNDNGSQLNCNRDPHFRGPNTGVDATQFGVVAFNPNTIPTPTTTTTATSTSATVSSATGLAIGMGISIAGAGAAQTMTTPAAPTITPSCASTLTGLGYTVPVPAGGTSYQYSIAMQDIGLGYTAASANATTTTSVATLGANNTAITSIAAGTSTTFTATVASTANLAAGCAVIIKGTTDDQEFGGVKHVASVVDGTHFTYTSGVDASKGITNTTATGGTVYFFLCNHLVLPTPTTGGHQYMIFGRTSGSMTHLADSLIADLGYTDVSYNTWDDYGSPMMDGYIGGWWQPSTPPGSPVNDALVTSITNIAGTTLTLANAASTSVSSSPSSAGNSALVTSAIAAIAQTTGGNGALHFPPIVNNAGTGANCYYLESPVVFSNRETIWDGQPCVGATQQLTIGNWTGTAFSGNQQTLPTNGIKAYPVILVKGANPGVWSSNGGVINNMIVNMQGNGGVGWFNTGGSGSQVIDSFGAESNGATDYMTIGFYDYHSANGGFGFRIRNATFSSGPAQTDGITFTPFFVSKYNTLVNVDYVSGNRRLGFAIIGHPSGFSAQINMGAEVQGNIIPMVSLIAATGGVTGGFATISHLFTDTSWYPMVANMSIPGSSTNLDLTINFGNLPSVSGSSRGPFLSGDAFLGSVFLNGYGGQALTPSDDGQNINITQIGRDSTFTSALFTPSIILTSVAASGNHTLVANEGQFTSTGTGTVTVDCTLKDGKNWDVYSKSGTTTLAGSTGCTLYGNSATGSFVIPNGNGVHVYLKGNTAYAYGLGGGGGGGSPPGGATDALQYNGGGGAFAGVNSPITNGNYVVNYNVTAGAAVPPTINLPGIPVNAQTGTTYTMGAANTWSDRGTLITASNAGAQTYTLVNPSTAGFSLNYFNVLKNIGTGAVTENASGFTINGGASLLIPPSWTAFHWSDGVNYLASRLPDFSAFPNCTGGGNALQFTSATGVFSCGTSSSGVASLTGDGALISNSLSTGAVTLTLATAGAHKVWMNNTGSTATPGYQSIGTADLPAVTVFNNQANTYSTGLQDFSAATLKVPTGAGFTAGATTMIGYDSTAKIAHIYTNNADADVATTTSTSTTTTQVLHATAVAGIYAPSAIATADLPAQYTKSSCMEVWGGSGTSFALTSGDDAISNNTCYNDSGVTRTITAVKCLSDNASNTTTVNPTFGSAGTGTTILSGALTCGSSNAMSSSGTVSNASWTTGTGINPVMGGTLTGTHIAMIVEFTF